MTLGSDEYDECDYVHIKVKEYGFEWIKQCVMLSSNS